MCCRRKEPSCLCSPGHLLETAEPHILTLTDSHADPLYLTDYGGNVPTMVDCYTDVYWLYTGYSHCSKELLKRFPSP